MSYVCKIRSLNVAMLDRRMQGTPRMQSFRNGYTLSSGVRDGSHKMS